MNKNNLNTEDKKLKCSYCGFVQPTSQWEADIVTGHVDKFVLHPISGDYSRCPGCDRVVNVVHDLNEVK